MTLKEKAVFALKGATWFAIVALLIWLLVTPENANASAGPEGRPPVLTPFMGKPDIVEVLYLNGEIGAADASKIEDKVKGINDNDRVKAVVYIVDSPGGGVSASAAIYEELAKLKVPVVGWCNSICASGGIYVLMAPSVKYIGVRQESISGSVGVIMQSMNFSGLLEWAKIESTTYKSGELKDSGNEFRKQTKADREYLQGIIDELAERFYSIVKKGRPNITDRQLDRIKTARIFIGSQAVDAGLVDAVMSKDDAIQKAKELSGSKIIFTRDEIKEMSENAEAGPSYSAPVTQPSYFEDLRFLVDTLREIKSGRTTRFEYLMPFKF